MELKGDTWYWIGGVFLIVVILLMLESSRKAKAKARASEQIAQMIETGTGGVGNNTVENLTHGVGQDVNYNPASDAKTIYDSACYNLYGQWLWGNVYCGGGDKAVGVFSRLTKSQLAALNSFFQAQYGSSLDSYIRQNYAQSEQPAIFSAISRIR